MNVVLVVPRLRPLRDACDAGVPAPALAALLASAGTPQRDDEGLDAALAARYGVQRQADWPLAPIRLAALGVDPDRAFWFCADPVTLEVGRDDVRLAGIVADLDDADAAALIATLNAHFAPDGLRFVAPRPDAWFVRTDSIPRIATHTPALALRRGLSALQPAGADAALWNRWQSEIQMLLHEHPVNVAREAAGRPPANSVWFSGGGTLPATTEHTATVATFADAGTAVALALHAGAPARALPSGLVDALEQAGDAPRTLIALPRDIDLASIERQWAAPASAALSAGKLSQVTLIADDGGAAVVWLAKAPRLWQRLTARTRSDDLARLLDAGHREPGE
jgi:hypothetical protein